MENKKLEELKNRKLELELEKMELEKLKELENEKKRIFNIRANIIITVLFIVFIVWINIPPSAEEIKLREEKSNLEYLEYQQKLIEEQNKFDEELIEFSEEWDKL